VRAIRNEADYVEETGERDQAHEEEQPDQDEAGGLDFIIKWKGSGKNKTPVYWSDHIREHAKSSEGASRIGCIANLAKAFTDIAIRADQMDRRSHGDQRAQRHAAHRRRGASAAICRCCGSIHTGPI
jgi:putative DNA primase/helicase